MNFSLKDKGSFLTWDTSHSVGIWQLQLRGAIGCGYEVVVFIGIHLLSGSNYYWENIGWFFRVTYLVNIFV